MEEMCVGGQRQLRNGGVSPSAIGVGLPASMQHGHPPTSDALQRSITPLQPAVDELMPSRTASQDEERVECETPVTSSEGGLQQERRVEGGLSCAFGESSSTNSLVLPTEPISNQTDARLLTSYIRGTACSDVQHSNLTNQPVLSCWRVAHPHSQTSLLAAASQPQPDERCARWQEVVFLHSHV